MGKKIKVMCSLGLDTSPGILNKFVGSYLDRYGNWLECANITIVVVIVEETDSIIAHTAISVRYVSTILSSPISRLDERA